MSDRVIFNLTDHWYPDKIGGSCMYAYKLHRLLAKTRRVETITLRGTLSTSEKGMVVHKVLHKGQPLRNRNVLRKFAEDSDAIWIVHSPWIFLHLFIALGFRVRRHVIGVYHGPWFHEYFLSAASNRGTLGKIAPAVMRYMIEVVYSMLVGRFVFLSENMHRATSRYLPIAASKARIIPMWSDKESWYSSPAQHDHVILSTFRRLEPRMGLQNLLRCLKRCDLEKYTLIICGDGPYRSELMRLIDALELHDSVQLAGWVSEEEKRRLIRESSAVIIPSQELEGFSLLALESLECGTPVLLTESVGFYEYVRDLNQEYVHAIDLHAPRIEIQKLLSSKRARSGLNRIRSIFDVARIQQSIEQLLVEVAC